jgi:hypothetical protein
MPISFRIILRWIACEVVQIPNTTILRPFISIAVLGEVKENEKKKKLQHFTKQERVAGRFMRNSLPSWRQKALEFNTSIYGVSASFNVSYKIL